MTDSASAPTGTPHPRHPVVITGIGVITPAGATLPDFTTTVWSGRSVAGPVTRCDVDGLGTRIACEVSDFDPRDHMAAKTARRLDPFAQFALAAALQAVADAGSTGADPCAGVPAQRRAIVCGTGVGGYHTACEQAVHCDRSGPDRVSPLLIPMLMPNAGTSAIALELDWRGPTMAVSSACASGTSAVGEAARLIWDGTCDVALAGGADNGVTRISLAAFGQMGALSRRNGDPRAASRPFDADRDGYVMGEGAVFLFLERADRAVARGTRGYATVLGYAHNNDAHHLTAPHPDGSRAAACMGAALTDAALTPADIGHVNAHGTATWANDVTEARALRRVFGHANGGTVPPVTASKGVFGHLMGGAGAAEAAVAALSVSTGTVPPTANHDSADPETGTGLDVVTDVARRVGRRPALSSSFGLGGHNACVVLGPEPGDAGS